MFRSWRTLRLVREGEGLPHGEETAVSGFESRLAHWVATYAGDIMSTPENETAGQQQQLGVPWEYEDSRGIRIKNSDWDCPDCDNRGELIYRPGSKNTCATCFYVKNGRNNNFVLKDFGIGYREGQRLLAAIGEDWARTPGGVANALRTHFDSTEDATDAALRLPEAGNSA